ncbi:MAG TPA: YncE family protein [Terriglobales bacterium]|nr:YncE family protein [Terriglobales bacterium]
MNKSRSGLIFGVFALFVVAAFAASAPSYHILKTWTLGGDGGWDYLKIDSDARRLYISRATRVMVINSDSGEKIGEIADTPGVHGIALVPEIGKGFTSNGREDTVSVFDLNTLKTLNKIKVGKNPDAIWYDSATKRIFTFNGASHDATAIDAAKGEVVGTIPLGGKPEFAQSDGRGTVFVNLEDKNELFAIDANKLVVREHWPLPNCDEPSGLAMDLKKRRLYVGCGNKVMPVVNADDGKVIAMIPIGDGVDATAFDEETGLAFASCGEGVLTVAREESPGKYSAENIPTQKGARTMALDSKTHRVYTVTAKFGPPPAPTATNAHPRPVVLPDSFVVLMLGQ